MILLGFASINSDALNSCSEKAASSSRDEGCTQCFSMFMTGRGRPPQSQGLSLEIAFWGWDTGPNWRPAAKENTQTTCPTDTRELKRRRIHTVAGLTGICQVIRSRWLGSWVSPAFRLPVKPHQVISFPDWRSLLLFQISSCKTHVFQRSAGLFSVSLNHLLPLTWFVYRICPISNKHRLSDQLMECYFRMASSCSEPVLPTGFGA